VVTPTPEVCDGRDNSCNGKVDAADPDLVRPDCAVQDGACAGATLPAAYCVDGAWMACDDAVYAAHSEAFAPAADDLCDGVDSNCDGVIGEDHVAVATTCGVGACAATGEILCVNGAPVDDCAAGTPAADD